MTIRRSWTISHGGEKAPPHGSGHRPSDLGPAATCVPPRHLRRQLRGVPDPMMWPPLPARADIREITGAPASTSRCLRMRMFRAHSRSAVLPLWSSGASSRSAPRHAAQVFRQGPRVGVGLSGLRPARLGNSSQRRPAPGTGAGRKYAQRPCADQGRIRRSAELGRPKHVPPAQARRAGRVLLAHASGTSSEVAARARQLVLLTQRRLSVKRHVSDPANGDQCQRTAGTKYPLPMGPIARVRGVPPVSSGRPGGLGFRAANPLRRAKVIRSSTSILRPTSTAPDGRRFQRPAWIWPSQPSPDP